MRALLSTATLDRLERATRVLLSPLVAPDADVWRREVLRATRELMGADHAMFAHSAQAVRHLGESDDDPMAGTYDRLVATGGGQFISTSDPLSEHWLRDHRANGMGVWLQSDIDSYFQARGYGLRDSPVYTEVITANGFYDLHGFVVDAGGAEAAIQFTHARPGRAAAGEAARPLLRALVPSFRAGLAALAGLVAHRATLDAVAEPLAVLDADGRERHRNAALVALLNAEPERPAVEHALWSLGRDLRRLAFPRRGETGPAAPAPMRRVVPTAGATYTLAASLLPAGAFGPGEAALVSVAARRAPRLPTPAEVAARTGLSAREAEVALLVAEGLTNAQIAERLFIAPGTVKRHVENVLARLELPTRAAVAGRLATP